MQTILITGANGFVGSHVLEASRGYPQARWIAACRDEKNLPAGFDGEVRIGDLRDRTYRRDLLQAVDTVVHAAAWTSLWGHARKSQKLFLRPTLDLLEDAVRSGVRRFVFPSTTSAAPAAAFGDPHSRGIQPVFWPHLANVVHIENRMRDLASDRVTMVNLRCGLFAGEHYGLGLLPILLPRLRTHLVPWVEQGRTSMPIVSGRDLGQAFVLAATAGGLQGYESFVIAGPEVPTARQVIEYLHQEFGYATPHFSVSFPIAYAFAWLMEKLDTVVPWEPLVVRSIIHLLEETHADNRDAVQKLGYAPQVHWKAAMRAQIEEMKVRQKAPMGMAVPG